MCQHPRCGRKTYYLLKGTKYGPIDLCQEHGVSYKAKMGGTLIPSGREPTPEETKELEGEQNVN